MCKQTDAELVASLDLSERGKRLRVHEYVTHDTPLLLDDLHDAEILRLLACYEIDPLTLALRSHPPIGMLCS